MGGGGGLYLCDGAPGYHRHHLLLLRLDCRTVDFDLNWLDEVTIRPIRAVAAATH